MSDDFEPYDEYEPPLIRDADIDMAYGNAESNRLRRLRNSGVCTHTSACGLPDSGEIFYAEQEGLKPGQVACTEHTNGCEAVFDSDEELYAARRAL